MCTPSMHDPEKVKKIKWGDNYTIKYCTSCECTIEEPVKIKKKPESLEPRYFGNRGPSYAIGLIS